MRLGRQVDVTTLPADTRTVRRFRVQPTITGVIVTLAVVLFVLIGPQVADPDMAGFVWAAALGVVVVGVLWPCVTVLRVSVSASIGGNAGPPGAIDAPGGPPAPVTSATPGRWRRQLRVGGSVGVPVRLGPRLSEVSLRWVDSTEVTNVGAGPQCDAEVPLTAVRRGRFPSLSVRVECDAPFGIVRASRAVTVELPTALEVGPRTIPVDPLTEHDAGLVGELATTTTGHGGDTTRSVRPYVSGDPAHLVHWPTSARTGALVVREMEPPADRAVAVVVDLGRGGLVGGLGGGASGRGASGDLGLGGGASGDLGLGGGALVGGAAPMGLPVMPTTPLNDGDDRAVEGAVARAAAVVAELRARGTRVLLCTAEPVGRSDEVGDDATVLSRLAGATFGEPGAVPDGWSVLRITPRGDDA